MKTRKREELRCIGNLVPDTAALSGAGFPKDQLPSLTTLPSVGAVEIAEGG